MKNMSILTEKIKSFFTDKSENITPSSLVHDKDVLNDLSSDLYPNTGSFFDDSVNSFFSTTQVQDILSRQKEKIMRYRQIASYSEVDNAIDEIVNEVIFSYDDRIPIKLQTYIDNKKLSEALSDKFNKITKLLNIRRNFYFIVKRSFIDGQIILHCTYDKDKIQNGIQGIKMIEPVGFYFDHETGTYKYFRDFYVHANELEQYEYSPEEIVREDFGIYDGKIILSYLEPAIKPANMLKTLEDLLIPLRFSRSISRRVFNVDIGDLPAKRGAEVMREYQNKFKYKKFYNVETGEVMNQQHITSMVEDYWFANRSGGRGTTVDVLDETGNLGELGDILYFARKLYRALKVPSNRINIDGESADFDYTDTRTTKEDLKFFMHISRIRMFYSSLFKKLLRNECLASGILKQDEWDEIENDIEVIFTEENKFIEKMKLDNFISKLDIYATAKEYQGTLFSIETILKTIFKFTDEEIREEFEKIKSEEKNPLFARFYEDRY